MKATITISRKPFLLSPEAEGIKKILNQIKCPAEELSLTKQIIITTEFDNEETRAQILSATESLLINKVTEDFVIKFE
jgi:phosphoribosylformylglycinamidine (FGAM) synthase PurS component